MQFNSLSERPKICYDSGSWQAAQPKIDINFFKRNNKSVELPPLSR